MHCCIRWNKGRSLTITTSTTRSTRGISATNIQASFGEIKKLNTAENTSMLGVRTRYLMA